MDVKVSFFFSFRKRLRWGLYILGGTKELSAELSPNSSRTNEDPSEFFVESLHDNKNYPIVRIKFRCNVHSGWLIKHASREYKARN